MKVSKFNHIHSMRDKMIFYNSKTGALATVDDDFMRVLHSIESGTFQGNDFSSDLLSDMKYSGAIIDDDADELKEIEFISNIQKYDSSSLYITILPTLDCNCRCSYCYEKREKGIISLELQSAILEFIKEHKKIKSLYVVWYGGEPLLAKDVIYKLSIQIKEYCRENHIFYSSSMLTNLTLMTESDCIFFKECSINKLQVTLDGSRSIHNKTRIEPHSEDSYGKIIKNLNILLSNNNSINIDLRINLNKNNISDLDILFTELSENLLRTNNLHIYPGKITNYPSICKSIESSCISDEDWSNTELLFFEKCIKYGFKDNVGSFVILKPRFLSCGAEQRNFVVIDAKGYLYKCLVHVGNLCKSYGMITDTCTDNTKSIEWTTETSLNFDKCRSCSRLPICMGGCKDTRFYSNTPACVCSEKELLSKIEFYMDNYGEENNR